MCAPDGAGIQPADRGRDVIIDHRITRWPAWPGVCSPHLNGPTELLAVVSVPASGSAPVPDALRDVVRQAEGESDPSAAGLAEEIAYCLPPPYAKGRVIESSFAQAYGWFFLA